LGRLSKKKLDECTHDEEEIKRLVELVKRGYNFSLKYLFCLQSIILFLGVESEIIVINYTDTLITAMNSRDTSVDVQTGVKDPHPCGLDPNLITNHDKDYEEICNCCQRHVCRLLGYCKSNKNGCRFGYPYELQEKTKIIFNETSKSVRADILLKRNDKYMNVHNRVNVVFSMLKPKIY
jgi:hypothetical protein